MLSAGFRHHCELKGIQERSLRVRRSHITVLLFLVNSSKLFFFTPQEQILHLSWGQTSTTSQSSQILQRLGVSSDSSLASKAWKWCVVTDDRICQTHWSQLDTQLNVLLFIFPIIVFKFLLLPVAADAVSCVTNSIYNWLSATSVSLFHLNASGFMSKTDFSAC